MIESSKVQYILIFTSSSFVISNIMTFALVFGGLSGVPWIIRISTSSPLLHNDSTLPTRLVSFRSSRNSCRINGILSTLSSLVFFKKNKIWRMSLVTWSWTCSWAYWSNFYSLIFYIYHIEFHELRIETPFYRLQIPALVPNIFKFENE